MAPAIELSGVTKQYGDRTVLQGISFEVTAGEVFALLGTNGAGKTTTLCCIAGLRDHDAGTIRVEGALGVQLQSTSLPPTIKVGEAVELFARWSKAPVPSDLASRLGLDEMAGRLYGALSTGQKRRLHLALALIGDPDVVILDEPTAGLDVEGRAALHDEIRALKRRGTSVLLASHDMAEVETLCDRIAILHRGEIVFLGTAAELTARDLGTTTVRLRTSSPLSTVELSKARSRGTEDGYEVFDVPEIGPGLLDLLTAAKAQSLTVLDVQIERPSVEQRFLQFAQEGAA